jgi:hypothetical protein
MQLLVLAATEYTQCLALNQCTAQRRCTHSVNPLSVLQLLLLPLLLLLDLLHIVLAFLISSELSIRSYFLLLFHSRCFHYV